VRSPIDILLDRVQWGPLHLPPKLALRCPACGKTGECYKTSRDPKRAVAIEAMCPECINNPEVEFVFSRFFNAEGKCITRRRTKP
jgi:hypothetical protein